MGKTQVTAAAYHRFVQATNRAMPSSNSRKDHPVVNINWHEALAYCEWAGGRLPTDEEWEYACCTGWDTTRYRDLDQVAWYRGNSRGDTHPVATKAPNRLGLHDVFGNVFEWCSDWFVGLHYDAGEVRVRRGGSYELEAVNARATFRSWLPPDERTEVVGFRCVIDDIP